MRRFYLDRVHDETGISGTGVVAEGICFTDGTVALRWRTATTSTAVYASMADVEAIHGHNGATQVVWADEHRFDPSAGIERLRRIADAALKWAQASNVARRTGLNGMQSFHMAAEELYAIVMTPEEGEEDVYGD